MHNAYCYIEVTNYNCCVNFFLSTLTPPARQQSQNNNPPDSLTTFNADPSMGWLLHCVLSPPQTIKPQTIKKCQQKESQIGRAKNERYPDACTVQVPYDASTGHQPYYANHACKPAIQARHITHLPVLNRYDQAPTDPSQEILPRQPHTHQALHTWLVTLTSNPSPCLLQYMLYIGPTSSVASSHPQVKLNSLT